MSFDEHSRTFTRVGHIRTLAQRPSAVMDEPQRRYRPKFDQAPCKLCGRLHERTHLHLRVCVACRAKGWK